MYEITEQQISQIVDNVVRILCSRQQAIYTTSWAALSHPLDSAILTHFGQVTISDVDANAIFAIARYQTDHMGVHTLLHLCSFGIPVTLTIHASMCSLLPVGALSRLPLLWQTHDQQTIHLLDKQIITYSDVCAWNDAIVVTRPRVVITAMAKETMQTHQQLWVRSEDIV